MRTKTIIINERILIAAIVGQLFDLAPNRQPRKAETIMIKVRDAFREKAYNDNEFYTIRIEEGYESLKNYLKELLMGIPEFQELNLTQIEYDKGISANDNSRPPFNFSSRYDKYDKDSWKSDFIDLDAFIQNTTIAIINQITNETDCFLCNHSKTEVCKKCYINPEFKNCYEVSRHPRGKYTFACKYDCFKNNYICCDECDEKDQCNNKCDCNNESCGLAINRIK